MKKGIAFKLVAVLIPLVLTSCNLLPNISPSGRRRSESSNVVNSRHTHIWTDYVTTKEATCTEDGEQERTCEICGDVQTKVIKASHQWGQWVIMMESTCVVRGLEERTCSVCQEFEQRDMPLADHTWDEGVVITAPTCVETGTVKHVCLVCQAEQDERVAALGHEYAKDDYGDDIVNWDYAPTCTEYGEGSKQCLRCDHIEYVSSEPLGHDIHMVDDGTEPAYGMAKVRLYECSRCGMASLGFKANEVSEESQQHLVFESEGNDIGARFWGRPIGNALALDSSGTSINQSNGEVVYCSTETGDFFEYKFDLTQEQAALLQNCYCYCDARPANYLTGDFWAYTAGNDEWTPGYYIDGSPEHIQYDDYGEPLMVYDHARAEGNAAGVEIDSLVPMGRRIENYRYILYVNGEPQDFDPNISVPVRGSSQNMIRDEYVMPYIFNLQEGTNIISLRMAGGYRSTFFNFMFRPAGM